MLPVSITFYTIVLGGTAALRIQRMRGAVFFYPKNSGNLAEGTVLKGWVHGRFGIAPTYHRAPLRWTEGEEDPVYANDRIQGGARTNAIDSQLDLLDTFCQYELARGCRIGTR